MSASGPMCSHGYPARYLDSGTRMERKDEDEDEGSNAFVYRTSNVVRPSRILKSRRRWWRRREGSVCGGEAVETV